MMIIVLDAVNIWTIARNHEGSEPSSSVHTSSSKFCPLAVRTPNHHTPAEAAEHMRAAIDALSAMAEKHGLTVMMTNALPNAIEGRVEHVERDAAHPAALNLAHCLLCGDIPTGAQLENARALLLSAPLTDDFGQLIDAHAPLHDSPLAPRVAALLRGLALDQYDFVCLDGDYTRFDEMYLDRLWLTEAAK